MTIDEKVRKSLEGMTGKTLQEQGVTGQASIASRFTDLKGQVDLEIQRLAGGAPASEAGRSQVIRDVRDWLVGRKNGLVARVDEHWLKPSPRESKRDVGIRFNEFRRFAEHRAAYLERNLPPALDVAPSSAGPAREQRSDLTLPGYRRPLGSIHPVTRVLREIEDIFIGLGFQIETGPEIETVYYNFDALNIPEAHPSRDDWDTLYVDAKTVLRTHTSPVQIRAMQKRGAPLYIIAPGKVYRHDNPDSSHATMFHQVEGLAVDRDITFADLKGTLDFFAKKFFGEKIRTSFHPSFFPFTEPSGEVTISCAICCGKGALPDGEGCRVCKESGWVEVMGCGMVHPEVLRQGGIDPEQFAGWAFGLGVERYAMMKYGINDIQLFSQSDLRFLEQF